jgi:hypothetical protein
MTTSEREGGQRRWRINAHCRGSSSRTPKGCSGAPRMQEMSSIKAAHQGISRAQAIRGWGCCLPFFQSHHCKVMGWDIGHSMSGIPYGALAAISVIVASHDSLVSSPGYRSQLNPDLLVLTCTSTGCLRCSFSCRCSWYCEMRCSSWLKMVCRKQIGTAT